MVVFENPVRRDNSDNVPLFIKWKFFNSKIKKIIFYMAKSEDKDLKLTIILV